MTACFSFITKRRPKSSLLSSSNAGPRSERALACCSEGDSRPDGGFLEPESNVPSKLCNAGDLNSSSINAEDAWSAMIDCVSSATESAIGAKVPPVSAIMISEKCLPAADVLVPGVVPADPACTAPESKLPRQSLAIPTHPQEKAARRMYDAR